MRVLPVPEADPAGGQGREAVADAGLRVGGGGGDGEAAGGAGAVVEGVAARVVDVGRWRSSESVGAVGAVVSILASALAAEAALWLPTLSEIRYW